MEGLLRRALSKLLAGQGRFPLGAGPPSLGGRFDGIDEIGLYLHIPFCRRICPYCPYNKTLYDAEVARRYAAAVIREIDLYAEAIGTRPVTSFYVGGGTPTTMLWSGLEAILGHIRDTFNMQCGIHLESHPNDLTAENLDHIVSLGVDHLSVGVEALQDHHLRALERPYTMADARAAVERAARRGFTCINADMIFALPDQTYDEVEDTGRGLVDMGVDQVAAYPLFKFPYTRWERVARGKRRKGFGLLHRRRMLRILEGVFHGAGFERTSVWAFTRRGVPKYCSVTVPLYVGLGASGSTYLRDVFYVNTFHVREYIEAVRSGRRPVALTLELSEPAQMAKWLYWRIYETRFRPGDFERRFGRELDAVYGRLLRLLSLLRFLHSKGDELVLTDDGAYWLHAVEDLFSLGHVGKLWGKAIAEPWPQGVVL